MDAKRPAWLVFGLLLATTLVLVAVLIVAGNTLAMTTRDREAPGHYEHLGIDVQRQAPWPGALLG